MSMKKNLNIFDDYYRDKLYTLYTAINRLSLYKESAYF